MKYSTLFGLVVNLSLFLVVSMAKIDSGKTVENIVEMDLQMDGFKPTENDQYVCTSFPMPDQDNYIVQYEALADAGTAHHILLFGCAQPFSTKKYWSCGIACRGPEQIIYAWAKNAPPLKLPKDVGFHVGGSSGLSRLVMQIHYAHKFESGEAGDHSGIKLYMTEKKQQYKAGIFLLLAYQLTIPPNTPVVHGDVSCQFQAKEEIIPFGYRTHAHTLGVVISGYQYNDSWHEIGKGNPQWPQSFYPVKNQVIIKPGDNLVARCTFNSTGRDRVTEIGSTGADEMCNFYIMYYTDVKNVLPDNMCYGNNIFPPIMKSIPADSDKPLPPNPLLEEMAHGHHHSHVMGGGPTEILPTLSVNTLPNPGIVPEYAPKKPSIVANTVLQNGLKFVSKWPDTDLALGQVAGVAVDKLGNLYIFHRGDNVWNSQSFNLKNEFQKQDAAIKTEAIIVVSREGKIIHKFGKNRFFLPHGITVDDKYNVWLTDVALHQMFRFPKGSDKPDLVLGTKFMPGNDNSHFCKPTDVAVLSSGEFFLSDGYCNSRILKFSKEGKFIKQFGKLDNVDGFLDGAPPAGSLDIPHSLAIAEDRGLLCVADRENERILCFSFDGILLRQINPPDFGLVYAIEYCPQHGGVLFTVNIDTSSHGRGYTVDIDSGDVRSTWNTALGLTMPHDVTVDSEKHIVYVGELTPHQVWKFTMPPTNTSVTEKTISPPAVISDDDGSNITSVVKKLLTEEDDLTPSLIIGALLVIPVVLLVIITVLVRLRITDQLPCFSKRRGRQKFNLGDFLHPHKGFNRLSTEESDHEVDPLNDSDQEEYTIPRKA